MYALLIEWNEHGKQEMQRRQEEPFPADSAEAALAILQRERPFLRGLPWHFAGQMFKLVIVASEVSVGEKFTPVTRGYD